MWGDFLKNQLWGTHRGTVMENNDPQKLGRIKVYVQAAYGTSSIGNFRGLIRNLQNQVIFMFLKLEKPFMLSFYVPMVNRILIIQFGLVRGFL